MTDPLTEFVEFPKVSRLNRDIVITEKIDGTNAAINISEAITFAQSRTRLITSEQDNFGFAKWVFENVNDLREILGIGLHFGEWFGSGIQRGYGLTEKRFALFNTAKWSDPLHNLPALNGQLMVVPVLYQGPFGQTPIQAALSELSEGSQAVPGYDRPEGIVIFHTAARTMFKVTLENDEKPKSQIEAEARENSK